MIAPPSTKPGSRHPHRCQPPNSLLHRRGPSVTETNNPTAKSTGLQKLRTGCRFRRRDRRLPGNTAFVPKEAPMDVKYPADAGATTYLLTVRGKVKTPTIADARDVHNATAGSPDGVAAARALGDLSHNVYTSGGNGAGADELLFIDYWNSRTGRGQFFADPQVQAGAAQLFADLEGVLWAPTSGFGDFHLATPSGAAPI